jgi:uncharacterized protein YerC
MSDDGHFDSPPTPMERRDGAPSPDPGEERRISAGPGDGSLPWTEAVKDEVVRRWDVVTPAATLIGRAERPEDDLSDSVRRLHDEQHPAMAGHGERMHRLDKLRITHALCSTLDVTGWERDRALGIVDGIDLTAFGQQRGVSKVALVVIGHVVDAARRERLGLDDVARLDDLTPDEMASLYDLFTPLKEEESYRRLMDQHGLDVTAVNRMTRTLRTQLHERDLHDAVFGRNPNVDPNLPVLVSGCPAEPGADGEDDASLDA